MGVSRGERKRRTKVRMFGESDCGNGYKMEEEETSKEIWIVEVETFHFVFARKQPVICDFHS